MTLLCSATPRLGQPVARQAGPLKRHLALLASESHQQAYDRPY